MIKFSKEAKEVLLCPPDEGVKIEISSPTYFKNRLKGKIIQTGDILNLKKKKNFLSKNFNFDNFNSEDYYDFFEDTVWEVLKTKPEGKVKITEKTNIDYLSEITTNEGLPKSKIMNVKKIPELKDLFEVNDVNEIIKVAEKFDCFINRFENKTKIVYFANGYYFIKKK